MLFAVVPDMRVYSAQLSTAQLLSSVSPAHIMRYLTCGALKVRQKFTDAGSSSFPFWIHPQGERGTSRGQGSSALHSLKCDQSDNTLQHPADTGLQELSTTRPSKVS